MAFRSLILATGISIVVFGGAAVGLAPMASADRYENCSAAADDGVYDIPEDSPDYGEHLDRDADGIGCES